MGPSWRVSIKFPANVYLFLFWPANQSGCLYSPLFMGVWGGVFVWIKMEHAVEQWRKSSVYVGNAYHCIATPSVPLHVLVISHNDYVLCTLKKSVVWPMLMCHILLQVIFCNISNGLCCMLLCCIVSTTGELRIFKIVCLMFIH